MSSNLFEQIEAQFARGDVPAGLEVVARCLAEEGKYHELFDVRLMQARQRLGLPVLASGSLDELPEPERGRLEEQYLAACREVGERLLAARRWRDAWLYLRPLGEPERLARELEAERPAEDSLAELVELALHEGVAPVLGFRWILEHYGTCNAISVFESEMRARNKADQRQAAALLVRHVHQDLLGRIKAEIAQREGAAPEGERIAAVVAARPQLFADLNYHIDTTHLAAAVRIARLLTGAEDVRLALDLSEYGQRLDPQYHFAGEEPFAEIYPAHRLFFAGQLGEQAEQALEYFGERARTLPVEQYGTLPAETYLELLVRLGRLEQALRATVELIPPGVRTTGFAPTLWELSRQAGEYRVLIETSRERGELIGFAAGLAAAAEAKRSRDLPEIARESG